MRAACLPPFSNAVEIMSCGHTDEAIIQLLMATLPSFGLTPFEVRAQSVGFIYNRIWAANDLYQNLLEAYFERLARPSEASEKRYLFFRKTLLDRLRDLQPKLNDSLQQIDHHLKVA